MLCSLWCVSHDTILSHDTMSNDMILCDLSSLSVEDDGDLSDLGAPSDSDDEESDKLVRLDSFTNDQISEADVIPAAVKSSPEIIELDSDTD